MIASTFGAAKIRWTLLAGLVALLAAGRAQAQTITCQTDLDCPGTGCGSQVCYKSSGGSMCVEPNTVGVSGAGDGWCASPDGGAMVDTNCKCHAQGAICDGFSCSFTIPPDGGTTGTGGTGGGGGSGKGGSTGTGGSGTGGSGGAAAGTSGGSGGGGGGCSLAGAPSAFGSTGAALLLAALLMRRRSRRRA
ncbi:MAG TPA: hypothetical protein VIF57_05270 [Polyangia bacterium]|jgi:hypothetical protein